MLPPSGSGIFMGCHIICILCSRKVIYSLIIMTYSLINSRADIVIGEEQIMSPPGKAFLRCSEALEK